MNNTISKLLTKWTNYVILGFAFVMFSMSFVTTNKLENNYKSPLGDTLLTGTSINKAEVIDIAEPEVELSIYEYGKASYYAGNFIGRKTANGETFTKSEYTCAHKYLPFGTKIKVTNLRNNKAIIVKVNDRGPFIRGRVVDLSLQGAKVLNMTNAGTTDVSIEIVHEESELGPIDNLQEVVLDNQLLYQSNKNN